MALPVLRPAVINIARQPQSMSLSIRKAIFGKRTLGICTYLIVSVSLYLS